MPCYEDLLATVYHLSLIVAGYYLPTKGKRCRIARFFIDGDDLGVHYRWIVVKPGIFHSAELPRFMEISACLQVC